MLNQVQRLWWIERPSAGRPASWTKCQIVRRKATPTLPRAMVSTMAVFRSLRPLRPLMRNPKKGRKGISQS